MELHCVAVWCGGLGWDIYVDEVYELFVNGELSGVYFECSGGVLCLQKFKRLLIFEGLWIGLLYSQTFFAI